MKDNKEFIKGIYDKYDEYLKDEKNQLNNKKDNQKNNKIENKKLNTNFFNSKIVKGLSIAAVFTIAISGVWISSNFFGSKNTGEGKTVIENGKTKVVGSTNATDRLSLKTVNDFETYYNIVKENSKQNNNFIYEYDDTLDISTSDVAKSIPQSVNGANSESLNSSSQSRSQETTQSGDYSKTNIQVENVDEADIVKTNGKYIFYVVSNKIIIVDIQNKTIMEKVAEIDYKNYSFRISEIYINDNYLIALGNEQTYSYQNGSKVKETSNAIYKKGIYKQKAVAMIYDITNIRQPKELRKVGIEGNYVTSRMIGNNIYFVANKSIYNTDILRNEIKDLDEDIYKPSYIDTISGTEEKYINFDRVYYFNDIETLNYLSLGAFKIDGREDVSVETFLGAGEDVYCSTENMYVVKSKNVYDIDTHMNLGKDSKILKFELNDGKIAFKAEADIAGGINNQFSMDENNGYFRIATTIGKTYNMDENTSNTLYILDKDLKEVGRLDGIAKTEKIYSVRYVGNKAYVVTFKEIDPLFVIDLSDVRNPRIIGELKIPGYSTYLHPYDETHLIGFGYDTKLNYSGTGVQNDGLKMAMFDVSDLNNPKELFNVKIGESGTNSLLATNHKALLFSKEKNLIAFPVNAYTNGKSDNKAQVYDIDLNKGFTLRGEIRHTDSSNSRYSYNKAIDRIIYSDNVFYTLSSSMIKANDMTTLKDITQLDITNKSSNYNNYNYSYENYLE